MHLNRLLQCISSLKILTVKDCKNGTVSLPDWLGDLTSLTQLVLRDCSGIKSLPESIQQLTRLQRLEINGCPGLVQWCETEENMMMLALIKEIILDGELLRVTRTRSAMPREQNLENKGGFYMPQDDDSKYERDLKKWGKDLKLSREIESLMTKDEKSGASEAGHDANALEDLPAQQFSLGSWIGSTTTPGTSRTQRRRKPVVKLIHRKGGTARPCHGPLLAVPQTSPIAGPSTTDIGIFGSSAATNLTSLQYPALPPTTPGSMYTFTATAHSLCLPPTATAKDENKADFGKLSNAPCEE